MAGIISAKTAERLELDSIEIRKDISRYSLDELIIHDDLLFSIEPNILVEIDKIETEIEKLESAKAYLRDSLNTLYSNHLKLRDAIVKQVKEEQKRG